MKKLLMRYKKQFATGVGIVVVLTLLAIFLLPTIRATFQTRVFSQDSILLDLWSDYKKNALEPGTLRTLDRSQGNITTSEGQSYTMLRSVWMDDQTVFDASWQWTKDNLQRPDHLMSWRFGKLANGSYGIQTEYGGQNSAADGDSDIALSLLMAYKRWKDPKYLYDATPIIQSIWQNEIIMVNGKPVLAADNLEQFNAESILINPSYLAPYSYKSFAEADTTHDWRSVADNAYTILATVTTSPFDKKTSAGLPPNWLIMNRTTGIMTAVPNSTLDTNYGYDAFRTPWRLALDWAWYKDPRDMQVLQKFGFLATQWEKNHELGAIYSHDGKVVSSDQVAAMYGTNIGYFMVVRPDLATQIYQQKLLPLYSPDRLTWKNSMVYYDDNWAWFGLALYYNALPNLAEIQS